MLIMRNFHLHGEIFFFQDRFGGEDGLFLAATNKDWPMVYAVPKEIEDPEIAASALADILYSQAMVEVPTEGTDLRSPRLRESESGTDLSGRAEDLYKRMLDKNDPYEPLSRRLSEDTVEKIEELGMRGIYIGQERVRHYPAGALASHILGFVGYRGDERVGQYGVEGFYDHILSGTDKSEDVILFTISVLHYTNKHRGHLRGSL